MHLCNENNARQPAHHIVCIEERRNRIAPVPTNMVTHAIKIILNYTNIQEIKQENSAFLRLAINLPLDSTVVVSSRVF